MFANSISADTERPMRGWSWRRLRQMSSKSTINVSEYSGDRFRDKWSANGSKMKVYFDLGTAAVVLAGLIGALRVTGKKLTENTYLFVGAGQVSASRDCSLPLSVLYWYSGSLWYRRSSNACDDTRRRFGRRSTEQNLDVRSPWIDRRGKISSRLSSENSDLHFRY